MQLLNSLIPLIQIITAVNFAYIAFNFLKKLYSNVINGQELFEQQLFRIEQEISADCNSLSRMSPLETNDGRTNKASIEKLKSDYYSLQEQWNRQEKKILKVIKKEIQVKGLKCLFLFVSIYCIVDTFNITSTFYFLSHGITFLYFIFIYNLISLYYFIKLLLIVIRKKWAKRKDVECYKKTISYAIITLITSLIIAIILIGIEKITSINLLIYVPSFIIIFCKALCLGIPFFPIVFSVLFMYILIQRIDKMIKSEMNVIIEKQKTFHRKKVSLDEVNTLFDKKITFE